MALDGAIADGKFKQESFTDVFVQGEMLYQKIDIDGNKLTLNVYNAEGKLMDSLKSSNKKLKITYICGMAE